MWLLKDINEKIIYLKPNNVVNVGRKVADIVLENDSSISRAHAVIIVTLKDHIRTSEESSKLIVKDAYSKYGTSITRNGIQMKVPIEGLELQPLDMLKFGLQHHIFKVEYIRFITVISRLSIDHKKMLKDIMDSIGGIIIDYYDDYCTHLTTTIATSTNKIISAIIAGIPIININYWVSVLNAIDRNDNLPDPNVFTLPLQDKGVNSPHVSLKPNPLRKNIFQGKIFIFFVEKAYKEYKRMIKEAGGKIVLYPINLADISEDLLADNKIIMQITDDSITDDMAIFNDILYEKMQGRKLRMIAETEIPLALLHVSLDQFCNPKFYFKELMKRKSLKKDTSEIIALDTQDISVSIPCTFNAGVSNSNKVCIHETNDSIQERAVQDGNNFSNKSVVNICDSKKIHYIMEIEKSPLNIDIEKQGTQFLIEKPMQLDFTKGNVEKVNNFNLSNSFFSKPGLPERNIEIANNHFCNVESEVENTNKKYSLHLETEKRNLKFEKTNESVKVENTILTDTVNSNNFESSINKQNSNFSNKIESILSTDKNLIDKKRPHDNSDFNETNKNLQSKLKNKEKINSVQLYKKRRKSHIMLKSNVDVQLELHKNETMKNKQKINKINKNKWGFKKSEKKVIDFDLDHIDIDEPKFQKDNLVLISKEFPNFEIRTNQNTYKNQEELFDSNKSIQIDREIEMKSFGTNYAKVSKQNIKDWNFVESSETKDFSENYNLKKKETSRSFFITPIIKLRSNANVTNSSKVFHKVYNQIPINRIALSNMTVWKPNI